MQIEREVGTEEEIIQFYIDDTSGSPMIDIDYNESGLSAYFQRSDQASPTAITLSNGTVGTWSSGGFKQVSATNMPGLYQLGVPNAAFASGRSVVIHLKGVTGMADVRIGVDLAAKVGLAYSQELDETASGPTLGGAVNGAYAMRFGNREIISDVEYVYASDGSTVVASFTLTRNGSNEVYRRVRD
jgi:hypothetical protein